MQLQENRKLSQPLIEEENKVVYKDYKLKDKCFYRTTSNGLRWMVPKTARWIILMYYHHEAGHFAV